MIEQAEQKKAKRENLIFFNNLTTIAMVVEGKKTSKEEPKKFNKV